MNELPVIGFTAPDNKWNNRMLKGIKTYANRNRPEDVARTDAEDIARTAVVHVRAQIDVYSTPLEEVLDNIRKEIERLFIEATKKIPIEAGIERENLQRATRSTSRNLAELKRQVMALMRTHFLEKNRRVQLRKGEVQSILDNTYKKAFCTSIEDNSQTILDNAFAAVDAAYRR